MRTAEVPRNLSEMANLPYFLYDGHCTLGKTFMKFKRQIRFLSCTSCAFKLRYDLLAYRVLVSINSPSQMRLQSKNRFWHNGIPCCLFRLHVL
jgi:hypothetical protein